MAFGFAEIEPPSSVSINDKSRFQYDWNELIKNFKKKQLEEFEDNLHTQTLVIFDLIKYYKEFKNKDPITLCAEVGKRLDLPLGETEFLLNSIEKNAKLIVTGKEEKTRFYTILLAQITILRIISDLCSLVLGNAKEQGKLNLETVMKNLDIYFRRLALWYNTEVMLTKEIVLKSKKLALFSLN